jgi:NADPH2:quinone reductase
MRTDTPPTSLQLRSLIRTNGELEVSLQDVQIPEPAADEVLVRIEATPINPSDLGLLFGAADMSTAKVTGTPERPVLTAQVPEKLIKAMAARADESMPVGNEGAGVVIKAGSSPAAQALVARCVSRNVGSLKRSICCTKSTPGVEPPQNIDSG